MIPGKKLINFKLDQTYQTIAQTRFMIILVTLLIVLYLISILILLVEGYAPFVPWYFLLYIIVCGIPFAYLLTYGILYLEKVDIIYFWLRAIFCTAIGCLIPLVFQPQTHLFIYLSLLFMVITIWHIIIINNKLIKPLLLIILIYFISYNFIWNLNYIALNYVVYMTLCFYK